MRAEQVGLLGPEGNNAVSCGCRCKAGAHMMQKAKPQLQKPAQLEQQHNNNSTKGTPCIDKLKRSLCVSLNSPPQSRKWFQTHIMGYLAAHAASSPLTSLKHMPSERLHGQGMPADTAHHHTPQQTT